MTYAVEILRAAQKQLAKLDRQAQSRAIESIRGLADPSSVAHTHRGLLRVSESAR